MEAWKFVKEEPGDDESYEVDSDYYDILDSYSTLKPKQLYHVKDERREEFYSTFESEQLSDVKIESSEDFYPTFQSEELCNVKIESRDELFEVEENNNEDAWKTASSYYPKLSIPLVRLEYSQNQEIIKYLKPLLPQITSSIRQQSEQQRIQLNFDLKTESVELETLTENTAVGSSENDHYASPWDFVSVANRYDQNGLTEDAIKIELEDNTPADKNLSEKVVKKKSANGSVDELFTCKSSLFACKICGKPGTQMSEIRRHSATHDATKRYNCDICKKKFKLRSYLHQHILTHNWEQYPCKYCSRVYRRKSTLRRHVKIHNVEGIMIKKSAPRAQISQSGLNTDKNDDKSAAEAPLKLYKCDVCGQRFEDKSSMQVHIEFLHIELFGQCAAEFQPRSSNSSLDRPFQCRTCSKRYTQSSHLKRHQESHSSTKSHICAFCHQKFSTTSSLTRHLLNKHNEIGSTRKRSAVKRKKNSESFTCKICDKVLTNLGDLRRHCATHDARKPYECDICKKQFAIKGYLYAHILTHDNWKPYPCQSCSKIYRRKSSLQRHIQISHSEKEQYRYDYT